MYLAVAEKHWHAVGEGRRHLQNDILKEYIAQKEYIFRRALRCA
jgi:methylmalonyl-CoA mutase N-terminal domain/subunit